MMTLWTSSNFENVSVPSYEMTVKLKKGLAIVETRENSRSKLSRTCMMVEFKNNNN
jgi:hypothetical protein